MKRILLTISSLILLGSTAYGWGIREHATVAQIAEKHLTPRARELMKEYLGGRPMAYYASHTDYYSTEMLLDIGFEPKQGPRITAFPHGYRVDENLKPVRTIENEDGSIFKHSLYHMERLANGLKENHAKMNDSVRLVHLYILIHGIGDMHCPVHVEIKDRVLYGKYQVYFKNGKRQIKRSMHGVWETQMVGAYNPWTYSDLANMLDTYTESQIDTISKGDMYDWAEEVAHLANTLYSDYGIESVIDKNSFHKKYQSCAEEQLAKAGYRLAKIINYILN